MAGQVHHPDLEPIGCRRAKGLEFGADICNAIDTKEAGASLRLEGRQVRFHHALLPRQAKALIKHRRQSPDGRLNLRSNLHANSAPRRAARSAVQRQGLLRRRHAGSRGVTSKSGRPSSVVRARLLADAHCIGQRDLECTHLDTPGRLRTHAPDELFTCTARGGKRINGTEHDMLIPIALGVAVKESVHLKRGGRQPGSTEQRRKFCCQIGVIDERVNVPIECSSQGIVSSQ
mmetsp:Transcript_7881/g.20607  ORF Transcript_7881/g.20607 Transcript_7881/m.20607 type:complete len:232 (+) Transcript_7881:1453-2148(+)